MSPDRREPMPPLDNKNRCDPAPARPPSRFRALLLVLPALGVYAIALALPSVKLGLIDVPYNASSFEMGYVVAVWSEAIAIGSAVELVKSTFGFGGPPDSGSFAEIWPIFSGATANHLFALACLAPIFRRPRLAMVLSALAALFALGCLLPIQLAQLDEGWQLGPGYFVWCAAPLVLLFVLWRACPRMT